MNAKEEARCQKLIDKIDACILRVLESKPYGTRIAHELVEEIRLLKQSTASDKAKGI